MYRENTVENPEIDSLDPKKFIIIKGAKVNNLKNLSVAIPRNKLVVVTGLSGSGKSSLAFDTLFAEGQRMYVESLSSYARQFLGRMEKPEVEYIKGVAPAIALEQKVTTKNPRSTVGTTTEIYDYLKLLFARIGITYSPISGKPVSRDTVTDITDFILKQKEDTRLMILAPMVKHKNRSVEQELNILLGKGFSRIVVNEELYFIEDLLSEENPNPIPEEKEEILIMIDRLVVDRKEATQFRLGDSIQTAFFEGYGNCIIQVSGGKKHIFSDRFEADGMVFEEPTTNFFSFNNSYGACPICEGYGNILGIDPTIVIPDPTLSLFEEAVAPWRSETMKKWYRAFLENAESFNFPVHRPVEDLNEEEYNLLWKGGKGLKGIDDFFRFIQGKTHKIQYRILLSKYRGKTVCPDCKGSKLRKDAGYVKINGMSIIDLMIQPVDKIAEFFDKLKITKHEEKIAKRILIEIRSRLEFLLRVGLSYLTLNRLTHTLSGGEYQRIKLSTSLGSALVGSMYILDEPSIGLHPRDTQRLISVLKELRDLGNTVIVVEHEEGVMRAADQIIDIGPDAGRHGGNLIFQGTMKEMTKVQSHTTNYLTGKEKIEVPSTRRSWRNFIKVLGAKENNLRYINVKLPLQVLTVITGVSGSGKSTLLKQIVYPAIARQLGTSNDKIGKFDGLIGDVNMIDRIEFIDQNPIGKSTRSNPVTYIKAYDGIRNLLCEQELSKHRGYKPALFSFNVDGGRCDTCQGEGVTRIEMQFMADIVLTCETCKGMRFKQEVLEVKYKGKNVAEILDLTVDDAVSFFAETKPVLNKIKPLQNVGMGYVKLGQASSTLSGGEAQRVKLASFLQAGTNAKHKDHILFIFDEPTTGLHFHDIDKLLRSFNALVDAGHSIIVIEHNLEIIKCADWIIDMGPDSGNKGGKVVFEGVPEDIIKEKKNFTGKYLKRLLS